MGARRAAGLLVAAALCAAPLRAAPPPEARVRSLLEAHIEAGRGVGLVAGLFDPSGERYVAAGARERGGAAAVDADTRFEIGSVTKVFTGVILAQEVVADRMDLEQSANDFLPQPLRLPHGRERGITLRDLATHTSGLPRLPTGFVPTDMGDPYGDFDADDLARSVKMADLESEPGALMSYSNLGYMLLSHLLVARSGHASFETLARERILCPLQMDACAAGGGPAATPHDSRSRPVRAWEFGDTIGGVGSLRMSARDLMKLARANLGGGGALGPALGEARRQHWKQGPRGVGLAWQISRLQGRTVHWHMGRTGGSRSFVGFDRAAGTAVVLLANHPYDITALGMHLLDPARNPL